MRSAKSRMGARAVAGGLSFTATWCFGQPTPSPSSCDVEVLLLRQWASANAAIAAQPSNLSVSVESAGSNSVVVAPGAAVQYEVIGILSDDINEGLALLGFDLDFDGGDLMQADTPTGDPNSGCENPMIHFTIPWGVTNPAGYGGTIIGGDLIQVGGAQNTILNTPDIAPYPIGTVLTGVAQPGGCGPALVVTGSLTAPAVYGTYTLALENLFANVILEGETGAGPFWATEAAGIGTITNLTIEVGCTGSGPENTPGACADTIDNDCDGSTDCADSDCFGEPACCGDGVCDALENECTCTIDCGTCNDCNGNGIPDELDVAACTGDPACTDCNANFIPDGCDIESVTSLDCNGNGMPDECDIRAGVSQDTDVNGIPDDCEAGACCNGSTGLCADDAPMALCTGDEPSWSVNTLCAELDPPCAGACCDLPTGDCAENLPPSACSGAQQRWTGGATCSETGCEAVTGACCDHDPFRGCTDGLTQAACDCGQCEWTKLAMCEDVECSRESIPTVGAWGLAILTLLLLTGAKIRFGRRTPSILPW